MDIIYCTSDVHGMGRKLVMFVTSVYAHNTRAVAFTDMWLRKIIIFTEYCTEEN